MKRIATSLSLVLCVGCADDDGQGADEGSTSAADTGADGFGDTGTPGPPDPTMPGGGSDDSTGSDGATGTDTTDNETEDDSADTEGDTGEPIDPAELPFGGWIDWTVQDFIAYGYADFYEIVPPDDPDYVPTGYEVPVGEPQNEDEWTFVADGPTPEPEGPTATEIDIDVGPQVFIDGQDVSMTLEFRPEDGSWDSDIVELDVPYVGGPWTAEIPGNDEFPGQVFEDVMDGPPGDAGQFELVFDGDGALTGAAWMPLDGAHQVNISMLAFGDAAFLPLCSGRLVDDGEAEFPAQCVGAGDTPLDPETYHTVIILTMHVFVDEVAWNDHRLRITHRVVAQHDVAFPYVP